VHGALSSGLGSRVRHRDIVELCAIGLGRVEGHGSKQVGYGVRMIRFCLWGWVGRVGALARDEL